MLVDCVRIHALWAASMRRVYSIALWRNVLLIVVSERGPLCETREISVAQVVRISAGLPVSLMRAMRAHLDGIVVIVGIVAVVPIQAIHLPASPCLVYDFTNENKATAAPQRITVLFCLALVIPWISSGTVRVGKFGHASIVELFVPGFTPVDVNGEESIEI